MNVRPATPEDLPAMLALLAADEEQLHGRPSQITLGDLREWTSRTNLAEDSWLFHMDGELAAVGWYDVFSDGEGSFAIGAVHPSWKGRGLGGQVVDRAEARAGRDGVLRLHQFSFAEDRPAHELFITRGYSEVRRFYEMAIHLEERPDVPDVGIETLALDEAEAFHAALDEAFQDHWEHHSYSFDEWWSRQTRNPGFDPSLWFLIREGGELAAVSRNEANRNGGGYVAALGVRRPWRGKGYAKALLLHAFREFYDRGMRRVTLGVDAESPTGATHLYERVGMQVEQEHVFFEKVFA